MDESRMPFTEHLEELRRRLIVSAITIFVVFIAIFTTVANPVFEFLLLPLKAALVDIGVGEQLIHYTNPVEPFFTLMKTSFAAAVLVAMPMLLYQFWAFVAPGLYRTERSALVLFVVVGSLLFFGGAGFGYFVVLPLGLRYLMVNFTQPYAEAIITYREFFGFAIKFLLAFGAAFELPLVMFLLGRTGILSGETVRASRRYAIVIIVILAAILTPPDAVTQLLLAGPLVVLYEISVWLVVWTAKKRDQEWEEMLGGSLRDEGEDDPTATAGEEEEEKHD